ncbi:MAG: hypothetical protein H0U77_12455 [Nocardioidaceae bacterium]|nr:hypothetical protein [Nocardioidaceae bacterium]
MAKDRSEPVGVRCQQPDAAGLAQDADQLCASQPGCLRRGGCDREERPGFWSHDAAALVGEGEKEHRKVFEQQAAEAVLHDHPVPRGVLLGSGEDCDGAGLIAIGWDRSVGGHVGAQ